MFFNLSKYIYLLIILVFNNLAYNMAITYIGGWYKSGRYAGTVAVLIKLLTWMTSCLTGLARRFDFISI